MRKNWEIKQISEVCDIFSGGTPSTRIKEYWNGKIPWLSSGETRNNFIIETERKITSLGVNNSSTRLAKKHDVVIASAGQGNTRGQVSLCLIDTYINQSVVALRAKQNIVFPIFLFYNLKSRYEELRRMSDSYSSRGSLPKILLSSLDILLPPLKTQKKNSLILYALDNQIQNLMYQNQILEKIIQSIFKSWFIDFDGQTEFVDSELGKIPKGWELISLGKSLSLLKDGSHNPPKRVEFGIKFIHGASDLKHFEVNFENCSYITEEDYHEIHKRWEIQPHDILLTIVGTIGNIAIVKQSDLPFSLQRSIAVLRPNEKIDYAFLYCLLNANEFKQFLYANINPTGQPGIYLGTLSEFKFISPPKDLLKKFQKISQLVLQLIQKNYDNIKIISTTRDSLLPKLLSGEIKLKN